jgi:hypothetical protein
VAELLQLRDQPAGVRFLVASLVPVSTEIVVGLVAFQHPVRRDQDRVRACDLARPRPRRFINRACWAAR